MTPPEPNLIEDVTEEIWLGSNQAMFREDILAILKSLCQKFLNESFPEYVEGDDWYCARNKTFSNAKSILEGK